MSPQSVASYEKVFTALGRFIDQEKWTQVCVMELEGGILLQGMALVYTGKTHELVMRTQVLDPKKLRQLMDSVGVK